MRHHLRKRGGFKAAFAMVIKIQRTGLSVKPDHADEQAKVADARSDKCLLRRGRRTGFVKPETNEQIASQTNDFPRDEKEEKVIGDDHAEHACREQREKAEEP